ncbi:MAG TPA: amino acid ABC transporter permease [Thermoanaerobaculia bacterium]|jgi:polar amino acid transport system permease protein|nr:amino acid ABC transporter permease [Thermoanaerobaculia bacterium]
MHWNFTVVWAAGPALASAFLVTVFISMASILIGTAFGSALALFSLSQSAPLRVAGRAIIELFLSLPALVVLVWIYFSVPLAFPAVTLSGFTASILGLSLSLSAFVAEIIRGGVNSIPAGELEVAYCTGLTRLEAFRYILLPQVIRKSWPPLMGQYITTYKFSTLASVLAVPELLHVGNSIIAQTYRPLEVYTVIAAIFFLTVLPLNILLRRIELTREFGGTLRL